MSIKLDIGVSHRLATAQLVTLCDIFHYRYYILTSATPFVYGGTILFAWSILMGFQHTMNRMWFPLQSSMWQQVASAGDRS